LNEIRLTFTCFPDVTISGTGDGQLIRGFTIAELVSDQQATHFIIGLKRAYPDLIPNETGQFHQMLSHLRADYVGAYQAGLTKCFTKIVE
jgi:hypothetical protein